MKLEANVVFTGKWGNAMDKLKRYDKIADKKRTELENYLAMEALNIVKRHIDKQDLPWTALSEAYKESKVGQELSDKIYVATGEFRNKLSVKRRADGVIEIGASGRVTHRPSGLSMYEIASILEFGAPEAGIPARPLFRPSFREFKMWLKRNNKLWASSIKSEFFPA